MSLGFSHETIITALVNFLATVPGFSAPPGRRVPPWSAAGPFPAMYVRCIGDEDVFHNIILQKTTIDAEVWIYCKTEDPTIAPGIQLGNLVDAVRLAFKVDNPQFNTLTLGGLVQHCWIEGKSIFDPGDMDSQNRARAMIPVRILVP